MPQYLLVSTAQATSKSHAHITHSVSVTQIYCSHSRSVCATVVFQYDLKPDIPKTEGRKLFFDTHAVVRLLEENGFSTQQAEVLVKVLIGTTNSNMDLVYTDMVTKVQQEIMLQQVMSKIAAVKKDMIILEKSEFSTLLTENEVKSDYQAFFFLFDVMNKVRSDNILDLNLEKSRAKDFKKNIIYCICSNCNFLQTVEQDRHLTQTNMKIDTEVAGLKTMLESHKLDTIKYLAGSVFTCLTVVLGFYRIWM
uniref:Mitochondrial calcium uniporter regulator 1 n=1 Tax=Poecilia latipinna TaxID=48699 RepID=A0A3B3TZS6_9TELE